MLRRIPLLLVIIAGPLAAQVMLGRPTVYDGDTFTFGDDVIRVYGIDAPERNQTCVRGGEPWECGEAAKVRLQELLAQGGLNCRQKDRDRYQRSVSACVAGGNDIGEVLVAEGLAVALADFAQDYVGTEARARAQRLGLWGSTFQLPADYRAAHSEMDAERPQPAQTVRAAPVILQRSAPVRTEVYFRNCAAARAAGAAPLLSGQPGYRPQLDADGDGRACEPMK
jgi:endonuclease YncB( thermonuclease family)